MGKSLACPYVIEYRDQAGDWNWCVWNVRGGVNRTGHGQPTNANAEAWRVKMNRSFQPGGVNGHVSDARGYVVHINAVRIKHNGRVVASSSMPMFEAV